jgi:nucleoside-diphosphate-sugar epimerase
VKVPVHLFIFGLGYSASRFAMASRGEADWVGGTVRSLDGALSLAAAGLRTFVFNGTHAGIGVAEAVRHSTALVSSVPPGNEDPVLAMHRKSILAAERLKWIGYLSTVGVYGDAAGAWVDEATVPHPSSQRSIVRLAAEAAWRALAAERGVPLAIFRIGGIYGPGRNAFVNLADGTAHRVVKPGQVFNRIHVDDIAAALTAALAAHASGVFNLVDDEPAPPQDVVAYAAKAMGVAPPPEVAFDRADLSPMARSFYAENKRVRNGRIKSELGVRLRYPTYQDGLAALWRDGNWRG